MKLYILFVFVFLIGCQTRTPLGNNAETVTTGYPRVKATEYYTSGIHYKIFKSSDGGLFILNLTKDSLEIENLNKSH